MQDRQPYAQTRNIHHKRVIIVPCRWYILWDKQSDALIFLNVMHLVRYLRNFHLCSYVDFLYFLLSWKKRLLLKICCGEKHVFSKTVEIAENYCSVFFVRMRIANVFLSQNFPIDLNFQQVILSPLFYCVKAAWMPLDACFIVALEIKHNGNSIQWSHFV